MPFCCMMFTIQPGYFCQGYAPIVDGPGGFIPEMPLDMKLAQSAASTVPIISGICRDDGSLYTAACKNVVYDSDSSTQKPINS